MLHYNENHNVWPFFAASLYQVYSPFRILLEEGNAIQSELGRATLKSDFLFPGRHPQPASQPTMNKDVYDRVRERVKEYHLNEEEIRAIEKAQRQLNRHGWFSKGRESVPVTLQF